MYDLKLIQEELQREGADGWLLVDYENKNPNVVTFLGEKMLTRKIFIFFLEVAGGFEPTYLRFIRTVPIPYWRDHHIKRFYRLTVNLNLIIPQLLFFVKNFLIKPNKIF